MRIIKISSLIHIVIVAFLTLAILGGNGFTQQDQLSDKKVAQAIESKLLNDELIASNNIDVETNNGIVTLSGWVANLFSKERSAELARTIKGVRSVINDIAVKPNPRTDEDIAKEVKDALTFDPATEAYEINVTVDNGMVTLTGTVDSRQEKKLTKEVVKGVKGIKAIKNNIEVRLREVRSDAEIETEIERQFEIDPWINDEYVNVEVNDGEVTLKGKVLSATEKGRAFSASWVTGVKSVDDSQLQVAWWLRDEMRREVIHPSPTDAQIKKAIEDAFTYDPRLQTTPEVDVENGTAILTGEVGNIKSKQAAEQVATHSIGVKRVKNYIKVRPLEAPEDSVIANRIQDALIADPIVDRHEIVVSVLNGVVTLTGTVGNDIEKLRAKTVASGISGVVEVDNDLRVTSFPTVRSDWELRQDIAYHLEWNPMINSDAIDISVDNGQAILEGKVDNWEERRQAREEALQAGAKRVVNNLKVKEKSAASKSSS